MAHRKGLAALSHQPQPWETQREGQRRHKHIPAFLLPKNPIPSALLPRVQCAQERTHPACHLLPLWDLVFPECGREAKQRSGPSSGCIGAPELVTYSVFRGTPRPGGHQALTQNPAASCKGGTGTHTDIHIKIPVPITFLPYRHIAHIHTPPNAYTGTPATYV